VPIDDERITVLLVGGDAGPGRSGLRTDAMVIASVDTRTNRAVLITVSRELTGFPLPQAVEDADRVVARQALMWNLAVAAEEAGTSRATQPLPEEPDPCCWLDRINALYPSTRGLSRVYPGSPDPGLEALRASLSEGLGLRIDYFMMVDMGGFVDVVDAIGGIRVTSRESMHVRLSPAKEGEDWFVLDIEPGVHHFDGRTALAYMRNRTGSSDIDRTRRQRCLMSEVAGQIDAFTVLRRLEVISAVMQRHTTTNIPLRLLPTLVTVVGALDRTDIATIAVEPVGAAQERDYRGLPVVDLDSVRSLVRRALDGLGAEEPPVATDECA
jgi:polyisoprenyl-teichoic acid--peptidoglycan teichoic acid transferase